MGPSRAKTTLRLMACLGPRQNPFDVKSCDSRIFGDIEEERRHFPTDRVSMDLIDPVRYLRGAIFGLRQATQTVVRCGSNCMMCLRLTFAAVLLYELYPCATRLDDWREEQKSNMAMSLRKLNSLERASGLHEYLQEACQRACSDRGSYSHVAAISAKKWSWLGLRLLRENSAPGNQRCLGNVSYRAQAGGALLPLVYYKKAGQRRRMRGLRRRHTPGFFQRMDEDGAPGPYESIG